MLINDIISGRYSGSVLAKGFVVLLAILNYWIFFPGLTTPDSDFQMLQGLTGIFNDNHPPIVSFIWGFFLSEGSSPRYIFLFHLVLFVAGVFLIIDSFGNTIINRILIIVLFCLNPLIINFLANIWKDVFVFNLLFFTTAYLLRSEIACKSISRLEYFCLYAILLIAAASRWNVALSIFPLAIFLETRRRQIGLSYLLIIRYCVKILLLYLLTMIVIYNILHPIKTHPWSQLFVWDIIGISLRENIYLLPYSTKFTLSNIAVCYSAVSWDPIWIRCPDLLSELRSTVEWKELYNQWFTAIYNYPTSYIVHRLSYFYEAFGFNNMIFTHDPTVGSIANGYHSGSALQLFKLTYDWLNDSIFTIFFRNGFWFIAPLVLCYFTFKRSSGSTLGMRCTVFSALLYVWPLIINSTGYDFRYVYWSIGASFILLMALLSRAKNI